MGRKNGHIRWDRGGTSAARAQHGKGKKRRSDWHSCAGSDVIAGFDTTELPDLGTGADPTTGAPVPLRGKGLAKTRRAQGGAV